MLEKRKFKAIIAVALVLIIGLIAASCSKEESPAEKMIDIDTEITGGEQGENAVSNEDWTQEDSVKLGKAYKLFDYKDNEEDLKPVAEFNGKTVDLGMLKFRNALRNIKEGGETDEEISLKETLLTIIDEMHTEYYFDHFGLKLNEESLQILLDAIKKAYKESEIQKTIIDESGYTLEEFIEGPHRHLMTIVIMGGQWEDFKEHLKEQLPELPETKILISIGEEEMPSN